MAKTDLLKTPMKTRVRASAICLERERILMVRLKDPQSGNVYLSPPGGGIEAGEDFAEAAQRETLEETGYRVAVCGKGEIAVYPFHWAGRWFQCTTHFFPANRVDSKEPQPIDDDACNLGCLWLPLNLLEESLNYSAEVQNAILKIVSTRFDKKSRT